ncbi:hypothetical protein NXC12_CH01188 [Rhizobium etli]|uniref:GGDEF domain-containing protein n=1 Tax=Rhizobium etli TaxID=29449 RepID=A0AAN1BDL0_RHIET|nr:hypothetical protein NXC12_CH01188 [Rhizobium etli]
MRQSGRDGDEVRQFDNFKPLNDAYGFHLGDHAISLSAGRILCHDRTGAEALFPLMRCSIGVLELPEGLVIDDINRVSAEIAVIKSAAKESEEGLAYHFLGEAN